MGHFVLKRATLSQHVRITFFFKCKYRSLSMDSRRSWFPRSKITKVNLAWGALIIAGLSSFVLARNAVMDQRVEKMKIRRKVEQEVHQEIEEAAKARRN